MKTSKTIIYIFLLLFLVGCGPSEAEKARIVKIEREAREAEKARIVKIEKEALKKNLYSLVEIGKGTPTKTNQIDYNNQFDVAKFNANNIQKGFVANHSKTLNLDIKVTVKFIIERTTTVTMFFVPVSKTETESKYRSITVKGLAPGEVRPFKASMTTDSFDMGGVGSSNTRVKSVSVSAKLISSNS